MTQFNFEVIWFISLNRRDVFAYFRPTEGIPRGGGGGGVLNYMLKKCPSHAGKLSLRREVPFYTGSVKVSRLATAKRDQISFILNF